MKNVKLTLEYDGSRYLGFQRQKQGPTVQQVLEEAAEKLFGKRTRMIAAGRTDRGTHAEGQVVNFYTESTLPLEKMRRGLNHYLPEDVVVAKIQEVPQSFHARFSARAKTYRYRVLNSETRSPLGNHTAYQFAVPLDLRLMRKGARMLEGQHDFRAFHSAGRPAEDTVRTIFDFRVTGEGRFIEMTIKADGFLYKMVRNIVGTLLWLGCKKIDWEEFREILTSRDRRRAGPAVPAKGLTLVRVRY